MDWFSFIASDIRSLAWPAAVVIILVVLKREIATLLRTLGPRLHRAKGVWGELTFGQGVDDVENKLSVNESEENIEPYDLQRIEKISELAHLPPSYTVSQAWLRLEKAIRGAVNERLASNTVSGSKRPLPLNTYLKLATEHQILPEDSVSVISDLRRLRNNAAHSLEPDISVADALRYNDIADGLIRNIEMQRNNAL